MRVAVISPHACNNGNTTLAMLIGLEFASQNKLTCLTHIKPTSSSFYKYLSFKSYEDKTSTPSQIVKILKEGGLTGDEARDYCKQITDDLEAFTNQTTNFNQDDMNFMFRYIAKAFPHEHVIFDVDDDNLEQCAAVIKLCDVIVLNLTQSVKELDEFRANKEKYMAVFGSKPMVVVVNQFNSVCGSLQDVAKWMGIKKPNGWVVLHQNPWIRWATNKGKLNSLFNNILKKDPRVMELQSDLFKICSTIARAKATGDKKRGGHK